MSLSSLPSEIYIKLNYTAIDFSLSFQQAHDKHKAGGLFHFFLSTVCAPR